jgi:hypothetical protein
MNSELRNLALAALALVLGGCATSSVKQSWKSPACQDRQFKKIAILAVDEREFVRQALESRFLRDFREHGQAAMDTFEVLSASAIQADKAGAAARFIAEGADAILIVRLVDQTTYDHQVQAYPQLGVPHVSGYDNYDWYDFYTVACTAGVPSWSHVTQDIYLDSSLFDLKSKQRLWSALTLTVLNQDADKLVVADSLVAKLVSKLHQDGLVPH